MLRSYHGSNSSSQHATSKLFHQMPGCLNSALLLLRITLVHTLQMCMTSSFYLYEFLCFTTLNYCVANCILIMLLFSHSVTISSVELTATDQGRGISIGEITSFVCEVTTVCPLGLNITWFRAENSSDVQLFQNDDNISITTETLSTTMRSTLTIRVTGMEDYTQYYCLANSGNSTEMSFTVALEHPGEALLH